MDWRHPDYLPRRKWDTRPAGSASFDRDGKLLFPMASQATKARLLADARKSLPVTKTEQGATIQLPPTAPDAIASVVELEIKN